MKKIHYYLIHQFKILVLVLCLIIILAGYFLLINPKIKKMFSSELDPRTLEKNLLLQKDKFNQLTSLKEDFEKIDPVFLKKIEKIFPENDESLNFIILLENLIRESNFSTPGINFSLEKTSESPLPSVQVNLNLQGGSYQSFKNFLKVFERNLRIIDVKSISLSSKGSSYSLALRTYFLPSEEKETISNPPSLKKISDFINSRQFLELEERRELAIPLETIQIGRPNPFLPF